MRQAEKFQARKTYKCQRCGQDIKPGQFYYKRRERGRVHNRMTYWDIPWHANPAECIPKPQ